MRIRIVLGFVICLITQEIHAQNDADALRYSIINWGSTARSLGMGNAFGALGADPSVMATNPAGLSLFRKSEFSFSPTFTVRNSSTDFLGNKTDESNFKFGFGNLGFVWAWPSNNENEEWKGYAFGIGYNRLNDFGSKSFAEGVNTKNSLLDSYIDQVIKDQASPENYPDLYPFDINLAWDTYLLDSIMEDSLTIDMYSAIPPGGGARQRRTVETRGGMGEWDFSFGANYMDKIHFGATLGLVSLSYREDVTWEETDVNNTIASSDANHNFKSYNYTQNLSVDGSGFNIKFGMIYKPTDYLRIGAAIHTPTFLNLTDNYKTSITAQYDGGTVLSSSSPESLPFEYKINTPFRFIGSAAVIIGKYGIISCDYEYVNYSKSEINPKDKSFTSDFVEPNKTIANKYTSSNNFRIGGEARYNKLRFRLGTAIYGSPFASGYNTSSYDQSRLSLNGGIGVREKNFYFDVGYSHTKSGMFEGVYETNDDLVGVKNTTFDNRLMFTLGFNY